MTAWELDFMEERMNRRSWPVGRVIATLALAGYGQEAQAQAAIGKAEAAMVRAPVDWTAVEKAMGRSGALQPGDVYKFGLPRGDLTVTVDRVQLKPTLALGSWGAIQATSAGAIAIGDLELRDDEVEPAMSRRAAGA